MFGECNFLYLLVCIILNLIVFPLDPRSRITDQSPIKVIYDKETDCDLCAYSHLSHSFFTKMPGFTPRRYADNCYKWGGYHYEWLLLLCKFTKPSLESLKVIWRLESQGSMSKGLGSLRSTLPEIREQEGIEREIQHTCAERTSRNS